jgi:hypothetical protein
VVGLQQRDGYELVGRCVVVGVLCRSDHFGIVLDLGKDPTFVWWTAALVVGLSTKLAMSLCMSGALLNRDQARGKKFQLGEAE